MYFINCFIYTINKILKFKVVLLSLSGSECTLVNIQNSLRAFWSPDIFPALFHTWVCCSCWKKRIKMSAPSTPRGRKRSRGSPPREYILINAIIIPLLISLPWFYIMLSLIQFLRWKCVDLFCTRVHRNYFDRCQPLGTLLVNMWINLITFSSGMNTWKKRNSLT